MCPRIDRDPGKIPVPVKIGLFAGIPVPVKIVKFTGIPTGILISNFLENSIKFFGIFSYFYEIFVFIRFKQNETYNSLEKWQQNLLTFHMILSKN